jgi:endogenous inhibitor of DNA gyrase (YacG/DUF329 family)
MYCPKCGQQQIADNMSFCSRCGLPVNGLAEWLAGEAVIQRQEVTPRVRSPKRKGISRGAKLIFLSVVLAPLFLGLSFIVDSPVPLFVPFTIFLGGLSFVLYSSIFGDDVPTARSTQSRTAGLSSKAGGTALPSPENTWANRVGRRQVRTAELIQPPSVTENTTKLLRDD